MNAGSWRNNWVRMGVAWDVVGCECRQLGIKLSVDGGSWGYSWM